MPRIVTLGISGGVGKSTTSKHLLYPRMNKPKLFAIESINESMEVEGAEICKMRGEQFKNLLQELMLLDDALVDVGASNIEMFLEGLHSYTGSQKEFDFFVIPVTSGAKETSETISLIQTLAKLGVEPQRIRILFNKVERDVADEFRSLIRYLDRDQNCAYDIEAAIYRNDVFDMLQRKGLTIADVLADITDYRTLARAIPEDYDDKQRNQYLSMYLIKSLCPGVDRNLDIAYAALFIDEALYE